MRTAEPPTRLRDFGTGQKVVLAGVERELVIKRIREDGYYELHHPSGAIAVTASAGHLAEEV